MFEIIQKSTLTCPGCGTQVPTDTVGETWTIRQPRDVADRLIGRLGQAEREVLMVLSLNVRNRVVNEQTVYVGNVSASLVRIAELFTTPVRLGAAGIIIAHNHPSNDPSPSADDLHVTAEAIAAGRLLDIDVLDHIVVARDGYVSLRDRGVQFTR